MKKEGEIAPEAYPGEEPQKDGDQKLRAPSIRPLLSEEIRIGHSLGLKERSTWGNSRSRSSEISHSSTGSAFAKPATRLVGNCC